ncbi:exonuclease subunit SbcD [Lentimicrobium sp. L6]|uniref:exonuclease subunit SbcD n=1 Tax=Lentimicrobium sp. L6 TaxID=2735916 RepID=UPI0015569C23|nr:exonuclease subunit SbcD [Lentimicrobium sp. L6]NPD86848.1 exonuclease subunit SbcD [Lentimicrobium sp. L6]
MKLLHTSDWHLGHRLHEQSQFEEQSLFLTWLHEYIIDNEIEILLISGDIFDNGTPSSQSLKLYYDFLVQLTKTNCNHIVIIGGNHDSPGTLNAPKELLNALSIKVVGKASEDIKDEVFKLNSNSEEIIIAAIPYLRDQDIRKAVAGEAFDEITERYKKALTKHYTEIAEYCDSIKSKNTPIIAMGHLFAAGGSVSESEQNIYVGNLGHIGAQDFPKTFDYIALGHLHRAQTVGGVSHIRYCGSPYILSFSEINSDKKILVIETKGKDISSIEEFVIPQFRVVIRVTGNLKSCIIQLGVISSNSYQLKPWVEVVLDNEANANMGYAEIHKAADVLDLEILKVTLKNQRNTMGLEQLIHDSKKIKALSPIDVFKLKCEEQNFNLDENEEIMDAFSEILNKVREY